MKKKAIGLLAVVLAAGMLVGCSSGDTALKDMDVDKYVTLGDYKNLEVPMDPIAVDQEQWDNLVKSVYMDGASNAVGVVVEDGITDRAVAEGDVVNIDYEGKKDGVAFQGGTAQAAYLGIGSGRFIEGFEEGLVGVMPGETVDLQLAFPENYDNTDLAGQDVVFTVTINYIMPEGIHDALVPYIGIEGVSTGEELRQFVYDYLYSIQEQNYQNNLRNKVMNVFLESCIFEELPKDMLQKYEEEARESIQSAAASAGMEEEAYVQYAFGMELEDFLDEYVPKAVQQDLAVQAVANREGLNIDDEELNTLLTEYAQNLQITVEEFVGEESPEYYREYFLYNKVLDFLVSVAKTDN